MERLKLAILTVECTNNKFDVNIFATYVDEYTLNTPTSIGYVEVGGLDTCSYIKISGTNEYFEISRCTTRKLDKTTLSIANAFGEPNSVVKELKDKFKENLPSIYSIYRKHLGLLDYTMGDIEAQIEGCGISYENTDDCLRIL